MVCNANVYFGYKGNMFDVVSGNVVNFMSLGCFSWCNASVNRYDMHLVDEPRKITWNT